MTMCILRISVRIGLLFTLIGIIHQGFGQDTSINDKERIVTTILAEPYLMVTNTSGGEEYRGFVPDVIAALSRRIGIKYKIKPVKDGKRGSVQNGVWDGMVGEIVQRRADLAFPLDVTFQRARVVNFTLPYSTTGLSILMNKDDAILQSRAYTGIVYLEPFTSEVWFLLFVATLVVCIAYYLVHRFNPYENDNTDSGGVLGAMWFACGGLSFQGSLKLPKSVTSFLLGVTWSGASLVLVAAYIMGLYSTRAFWFSHPEVMMPRIQDLTDLTEQSYISFGVVKYSASHEILCNSKDNVLYQHACAMTSRFRLDSAEDGLACVKFKGRFALIAETDWIDYVVSNNRDCNLVKVEVGRSLSRVNHAAASSSDIFEHVNLALREMQENGLLNKLENKWFFNRGRCPSDRIGEGKGYPLLMDILQVYPLFLYMIVGIAVAAVALAIEIVCFRRRTSKKQPVKAEENEHKEDTKEEVSLEEQLTEIN